MSHPLLRQGADTIFHGFEDYHDRFRAVTRRAKSRFERCDWHGIRRDTRERFTYHPQALDHTLDLLRDLLGTEVDDLEVWSRLKTAYAETILGRDDFELAQTFFNSLTRRLHPHAGVDPRIDFVQKDFPLPYRGWELAGARTYAVHQATPALVRTLLRDADLRAVFRDLDATAERAAADIQRGLDRFFDGQSIDAVDMLRPVFLRNKGAYLVGRARRGRRVQPLVLALVNGLDPPGGPPPGDSSHEPPSYPQPGSEGVEIDAVLQDEDDVSVVFSFARWYFLAEVENPRAVIGFLSSILPRKRIAELYISLGYYKHGKTELYADLTHQIAASRERFEVAPGQRGLVMAVFTLPSYEFVFKVIRDHFPPSKKTTRQEIRKRYRQVLLHDRVGRLVDFQEFEDLVFPRGRFSDELLDELLDETGQTVAVDGDRVIIRHMYVGRRVRPLDLYVREVPTEKAVRAVVDWGHALKDLAAANIFAGDMLLKNFGVTRHGRVVFYDYDELRPLTDCRFRAMPEPRDEVEALSPEPHFSVDEADVFPEELRSFLGLRAELRAAFEEHHADLYGIDFWQRMQERQSRGDVVDFFPYRRRVGTA